MSNRNRPEPPEVLPELARELVGVLNDAIVSKILVGTDCVTLARMLLEYADEEVWKAALHASRLSTIEDKKNAQDRNPVIVSNLRTLADRRAERHALLGKCLDHVRKLEGQPDS